MLELVHLFQQFPIHPSAGRLPWLDAVDEKFASIGADFHALSGSYFRQSFSELFRVLLHFFLSGRSSANCKLQRDRPSIDTMVSQPSVLSFPGIY